MRRHPSLKSVQAFEAAARLGSFTAAAQELCVTASAISHQIRFLEKEVGVALFHRTSRTVVLTDVGARYARNIAEALGLIEAATRDIERRGKSDILTIHCVPSFAAQWLMPRLARFSAQHSSIDVRLNASVSVVDLAAGTVDVDIRYGSVLATSGVVTLPLPDERIVALGAPALVDGPHPIRRPADLRHHTLIHSEINLFNWRAFARLHSDIVLDLERGPRFDRSFMAISAAVDGLGICLESQLLVQRELDSGRLVVLFGESSPQISCHSLSILKSKLNVPKIKAFREWLFEELQQPLLG